MSTLSYEQGRADARRKIIAEAHDVLTNGVPDADFAAYARGWRDERVALTDALAAIASPLPPAPRTPERFPQPADFQEETVIGHIAGEPVIGLAGWDTVTGKTRRWDVEVKLGGLTITTDGETLTIDATESGCDERWKVAGVGQLVELAQAGYLAELITLARRWCSTEPPVLRLARAIDTYLGT